MCQNTGQEVMRACSSGVASTEERMESKMFRRWVLSDMMNKWIDMNIKDRREGEQRNSA